MKNKSDTLIFVQLELHVGSCSVKYGGHTIGAQNDSNSNVSHV